MAIKKKLIHFKNYSDFNSKKLSANEANTQYTQGVGGAIQNGSPDILYQSICWIKDTKQQWTHGQLYDLSGGGEMPDLADVAFSGDYDDLSNKPTIPAEQVNADWNATSGKAQILNKPTIPNGTITGVSANGTSVATSGVANIPAATTGKYGVTKLSSATNSTSTTLAATASAVKSAYDLANGKYTKPSTGIPKTDMTSAVQTSLGKADSAVQRVSASIEFGDVSAGNFFNVNKDANGNVSIKMIQNTLASGKTAIPYTTDVKQYIDNAVANAGGGTGGSGGGSPRWVEYYNPQSPIVIDSSEIIPYIMMDNNVNPLRIDIPYSDDYKELKFYLTFVSIPTIELPHSTLWVNNNPPILETGSDDVGYYEFSFVCFEGWRLGVWSKFNIS